jgi:N-acetylglutamate synthase-like GNAT family acetyltransferase
MENEMIRQFRSEDAQSCCSLIHACIESDISMPASLRQKIKDMESASTVEERARLYYLAVYDSGRRLLGIAGMEMNEIRLLCVSPEHRRTGIGRALLEHLCSMVPGFLFPDIFVYSSTQAVEFYRTQGFIEEGPVLFAIRGEMLRTIFMKRPLP